MKILKSMIIALGLAGSVLATASSAGADPVGVSFNFGNVAFGYQDGYWDQGHHWHHWRNHREQSNYRSHANSQYYNWGHNRDNDHGWHDHR